MRIFTNITTIVLSLSIATLAIADNENQDTELYEFMKSKLDHSWINGDYFTASESIEAITTWLRNHSNYARSDSNYYYKFLSREIPQTIIKCEAAFLISSLGTEESVLKLHEAYKSASIEELTSMCKGRNTLWAIDYEDNLVNALYISSAKEHSTAALVDIVINGKTVTSSAAALDVLKYQKFPDPTSSRLVSKAFKLANSSNSSVAKKAMAFISNR